MTAGLLLAALPDTLAARAVPRAVLDAYRADPDFQYARPDAEGPSLAALVWQWVTRTLLAPLAEASQSDWGTWALVALAVAALAWAVTRVLRVEGGGVFARPGRLSAVGPLLDAEQIGAVDLGPLLAAALAEGRLRDAVRFRFLVLLQRLDAAGALAWRRDKTNRDYAREVAARGGGGAAASAFAEAARAFDYVWYGERPVDAARYARLDPLFARAEGTGAGAAGAASRPDAR